MMPLGLTPTQLEKYHQRLTAPHDFRIHVDISDNSESAKGRLTGQLEDGSIDIQRASEGCSRTLTLTLHDPDRSIILDSGSPSDGAVFFDRMVRIRHVVEMPWGLVTAIPFIGPITKPRRDGSTLTLECQDKAYFALQPQSSVYTYAKGANAVNAIRTMFERLGERRFRFEVPARVRKRRLKDPITTGPTASTWAKAQWIADKVLGLQLVYSCDGALLLRPKPTEVAVTWGDTGLGAVGGDAVDYDVASLRNYVIVNRPGTTKTKGNDVWATMTLEARAIARDSHPMSPDNIGRNNVPWDLVRVITDASLGDREIEGRARRELKDALSMQVSAAWTGVPVFHLDHSDVVVLDTPDGTFRTPLVEGSIPLGTGGEQSVGYQRTTSKIRRTGKASR